MSDFERMLKNLTPTLRRIAHRLNGHHSFFDEDDLFQEAVEHLWVAFNNSRLTDKTDSYVLQGCYFHLKNYLRKNLDKADLSSLSEPVDENNTTLEDTISADAMKGMDALNEAAFMETAYSSGLDNREKTVLSMSVDGFTAREIGQRLGVSHVMVLKIKANVKRKCLLLNKYLRTGYQN